MRLQAVEEEAGERSRWQEPAPGQALKPSADEAESLHTASHAERQAEEEKGGGPQSSPAALREREREPQGETAGVTAQPQGTAASMFVDLMLAAGRALAPAIRCFMALGFNRLWLHSGDLVYRSVWCWRPAAQHVVAVL